MIYCIYSNFVSYCLKPFAMHTKYFFNVELVPEYLSQYFNISIFKNIDTEDF